MKKTSWLLRVYRGMKFYAVIWGFIVIRHDISKDPGTLTNQDSMEISQLLIGII